MSHEHGNYEQGDFRDFNQQLATPPPAVADWDWVLGGPHSAAESHINKIRGSIQTKKGTLVLSGGLPCDLNKNKFALRSFSLALNSIFIYA